MLFNEITNPQKRAFLNAFVGNGSLKESAQCVGVSYTSTWYWRRDDKQFNEAFGVADQIYRDNLLNELEGELKKRSLDRTAPMSTVALFFALKAEMPDKYRERPLIEARMGNIVIKWESMPRYEERLRLGEGDAIQGEINEVPETKREEEE